MKRKAIYQTFLDTLPVLTGYVFLGIGFGILMFQAGFNAWWSVAMGLFIYAGSAQYMAVELLAGGVSALSMGVAVFLVNARHLFYGLSMIGQYQGAGKKKPYLIFALTDETYSLVTQNAPPEGMGKHSYCFLVSLFDHIYWVIGCTLGGLIGSVLPVNLDGIEFVLTALFVTIFVEQWLSQKHHGPALIGVGVTLLSLVCVGSKYFLIPALLVITAVLAVWEKTGRREAHEA